jgi:DDE superfamily endonuclease
MAPLASQSLSNLRRQRKNKRRRNLLLAVSASFAGAAAAITYYGNNFEKNAQHTSKLRGQQWMEELLEGHHQRMKDNMGISAEGFLYLRGLLIEKAGLQSTRYMSATEQLGIFLYAVVTDLSMRKLAERFQRSTETIDRVYHKVMKLFLRKGIYEPAIQPATQDTPLHISISSSPMYSPFLDDCIGAVDGTHIPVSPPSAERKSFRDRSGHITQNVLAICNFDMRFTDVLSGWEGSVADSTLWMEAHRLGAVSIPRGKYVLGDAGFPNCDYCLTPYRGVRYHLKEWEKANKRPRNAKELFNLRHAKLRNVIERIFGVMKKRFKILTLPRAFKMTAQARVVLALCVLHNILRDIGEWDDDDIEDENGPEDEDGEDFDQGQRRGQRPYNITNGERTRASAKRDAIAEAMWQDYSSRRRSG